MSSQVAKPAKPAPDFAISSIAAAGTSFARMRAEQVDIGDQEILDAALFANAFEINAIDLRDGCVAHGDRDRSIRLRAQDVRLPRNPVVPASGTCAMAAASTVSATRSSGSRLWTWLLPQARAMVCASSVITDR